MAFLRLRAVWTASSREPSVLQEGIEMFEVIVAAIMFFGALFIATITGLISTV